MATLANPLFTYYVLTALVLVALLLFLWSYSGVVRGRTKTAVNPEDGRRFGAELVAHDPPEVARVLRAHRNAEAMIYPFLLIGLVFVCVGGGTRMGASLFALFVAARLAHAVVYLLGKQPWRTICFIVSGLATIVMMADIAAILIRR
jgi:prostaglandin-E synthase 1